MLHRGLILFAACALIACASGPHPAIEVASNDLDCEPGGMKVHEIYPKKVRVEGCNKEAIYVDACNGYGVEAECGWSRQYATAFERDAAEREKIERAEAKKQRAEEKKAEQEKAEQQEAELKAAEEAAAEQEKLAKAEQAKADKEEAEQEKAAAKKGDDDEAGDEKATAKKAGDENAEGDEATAASDKPESKNAKRPKKGKKPDSIDDFLK